MNVFRDDRKRIKAKKILQYCVTATLVSGSAHSALIRPLNDQQAIEVEVSRQGLTRIRIQEDRILSVFGVTGEYVLESDEDQGQIFIRPMGSGSLNPISLTLTTEKGCTQDLRLIPKEKEPEALILQVDKSSESPLTKQTTEFLPSREEIEEVFLACQMGRIPLGYKLMPLDIKPLQGPHSTTLKKVSSKRVIREIRGPILKGLPLRGFALKALTYEVKNTSQIPLIMAEQSFAESADVIAVFMPTKLLHPGEKCHVYAIEKVSE